MTGKRPSGDGFDAVLCDLLMAVMDSLSVWTAAAGDSARGLRWRDRTTQEMIDAGSYLPYETLVASAAAAVGIPAGAVADLVERWPTMQPWPDAAALTGLAVPYGYVTNCSSALADVAARRSRLRPRVVLSAEEAGCYKPDPRTYRMACAQIGAAPDRTLFVAGAPYDAEGAHLAGLRAVLVRRRSDHPAPRFGIPVVTSLEAAVTLAQHSSSAERA